MLEKIRADLNSRLEKQPDSRAASNDEVAIAWLITEVDKLRNYQHFYWEMLSEAYPLMSRNACDTKGM